MTMTAPPPMAVADHPAKFSDPILTELSGLIGEESTRAGRPISVLDPFAGVGRIHELGGDRPGNYPVTTTGVELEPEWAACHPRTVCANALHLPFDDRTFDGVVTSPCLFQGHRILTDDLRWVDAGSVAVGDRLLAFEENGNPGTSGRNARRRWQRTSVLRSEPKKVECVRVILANGDELITTPEHPWLANVGTGAQQWITSTGLVGRRAPVFVGLQVRPWQERVGRDAGWLAGMFDGEGSLSLGGHGSPKLCMYQLEGSVIDHAEKLMEQFGYAPNRIERKDPVTAEHGRKVQNLYVTGGFPGIMRALGELRPIRLLEKWENLDISTRTVEAEKVEVLAVEPAGLVDIQEIETSHGTYIGEGYLHHNCYGNRMADSHDAADPCKVCAGAGGGCKQCKGSGLSRRNTYTHRLRTATGDRDRRLHNDNAGAMRWGSEYRSFHEAAYREALRVVRPGGFIVVNISNHLANGIEQRVTEWTMNAWIVAGVNLAGAYPVTTRRQRQGANGEARTEFELVLHFRVPDPHPLNGRLL